MTRIFNKNILIYYVILIEILFLRHRTFSVVARTYPHVGILKRISSTPSLLVKKIMYTYKNPYSVFKLYCVGVHRFTRVWFVRVCGYNSIQHDDNIIKQYWRSTVVFVYPELIIHRNTRGFFFFLNYNLIDYSTADKITNRTASVVDYLLLTYSAGRYGIKLFRRWSPRVR